MLLISLDSFWADDMGVSIMIGFVQNDKQMDLLKKLDKLEGKEYFRLVRENEEMLAGMALNGVVNVDYGGYDIDLETGEVLPVVKITQAGRDIIYKNRFFPWLREKFGGLLLPI